MIRELVLSDSKDRHPMHPRTLVLNSSGTMAANSASKENCIAVGSHAKASVRGTLDQNNSASKEKCIAVGSHARVSVRGTLDQNNSASKETCIAVSSQWTAHGFNLEAFSKPHLEQKKGGTFTKI